MKVIVALIQAGALSVGLLLAGCGGEPYTYVPEHELKPGPGLVTGEDGEFTIIETPLDSKKQDEPDPSKQTQ